MTDTTKTLAEQLQAWKARTGITNEDAAKLMEMPKRTWERHLSGQTVPHRWMQGMMLKVAREFEEALTSEAA